MILYGESFQNSGSAYHTYIFSQLSEVACFYSEVYAEMSQTMGNIVNRPILAVPVRLAAVGAFAATLPDRRKGLPARADP